MTPAKPMTSVPSLPIPISTGKKRKAMNEVVAEVSSAHRENAYKLAKLRSEAKTAHQVEKEKIKWKAANEREQARLEHKHQEAEAQQAHELRMLQHQFELKKFCASLQHASAGVAPMPTMSASGHAFTPIQPPSLGWGSIDPALQ